jgi:acyl transferase domain-containing protein
VLENAEIKWIKLPFTRAFHSNLMQSILPEFKSELAHIQFKPLKISVIDNVTATLFLPDTIPPADYFVTHLTQTMRFKEGLDKLFQEGCNTFIEIGPQTNLSRLGRSIKPEYQWLSSQSRDGHNIKEFLVTLAKLYCMNINEINFQPLFELWGGQIISLPNYPFLPETHWIKAKKSSRRAA